MVSARGTPVPALIGWGMLLFAGASHGAYELGAMRLAPGQTKVYPGPRDGVEQMPGHGKTLRI
jgi:hypothetical protein